MPEAGELLPLRAFFALQMSTDERTPTLAAVRGTLRAPFEGAQQPCDVQEVRRP